MAGIRTGYKVLNRDGSTEYGGGFRYPMPTDGKPGEWTPTVKPELCERGYHYCATYRDLVEFLNYGDSIAVVEVRGAEVVGDDKRATAEMRILRHTKWDERRARLFACDCAERVLPIYENIHPGDTRPRKAIETTRKFANGEATAEELAAAWDAAWAAARDWQAERLRYYCEAAAQGGE